MAKFAKDDFVEQIITPIKGKVTGFQVDQETGDVLTCVGWKDADGVEHSRYFKDTEIKPATPEVVAE